MNAKTLAARLEAVAAEYPPGCVLYHRGNGQRMVVIGYNVDVLGCVMIECDSGTGWSKQFPCAMTTTKPGEDGDEWKNDEPQETPR